MSFWIQLIIAIVLMVIAYMITPKPKSPSVTAQDMDEPTAEAGKPLGVVFGTVTIKSPNVLWFGDKSKVTSKVKA